MKKIEFFTPDDIRQIKNSGMKPGDVENHLAQYLRGPNFLKLQRPCDLNDGILSFTPGECNRLIRKYESEAVNYELLKFVPASGAASRMFVEWFAAKEQGGFGAVKPERSFLRNLKKMPFYPLIKNDDYGRYLLEQKNIKGLLDFILSPSGLNYGWLPKALITFHSFTKKERRTALEEHLAEAARYMRNNGNICRLHFTVSAEHAGVFADKLKDIREKYENLYAVKYAIGQSTQSAATDILAVDEFNQPIRDAAGRLVFRPGGHGALLKNLNYQEADFIFVKNIDNIVPDGLLEKILPYKKMLGGLALQIQKSIYAVLQAMEKNSLHGDQIAAVGKFCIRTLNIVFPQGFTGLPNKEKNQRIFSLLNRPLRVCAVVRNAGEPGGAPFWVMEKDGTQTVQIVESGHVDQTDPEQSAIWLKAGYFNPVDMVCCIRNYRGKKFDLEDFVDRDTYLISSKTEKGRQLKAQELPGLWNGGMARWNTVFVEIPLAAFNPVKTVYDLLRPEHQPLPSK